MSQFDRSLRALTVSHPFFAVISLGLKIVKIETEKQRKLFGDTAGTDGVSLYYNEEFFDGLNLQEAIGVNAHEVLHVALGHTLRMGNRHPVIWNIACDIVVNGILQKSGFVLPAGAIRDPSLEEMTAEQVYDILMKRAGDDADNTQGPSWGNVAPDQSDGQGGEKSEQEKAQAEQDLTTLVERATQVAKAQGSLPAELDRHFERIAQSKINWKDKIRRIAGARDPGRQTYARQYRHYPNAPIIYPGRRKEPSGNIIVAVDTSGSIGADEISMFISETIDIRDEINASTVTVIFCDADIKSIVEVGRGESVEKAIQGKVKGGGGTDFNPPIEWALKQRDEKVVGMFYFTDLMGPYPAKPPADFPFAWVLLPEFAHMRASWGEHVVLSRS